MPLPAVPAHLTGTERDVTAEAVAALAAFAANPWFNTPAVSLAGNTRFGTLTAALDTYTLNVNWGPHTDTLMVEASKLRAAALIVCFVPADGGFIASAQPAHQPTHRISWRLYPPAGGLDMLLELSGISTTLNAWSGAAPLSASSSDYGRGTSHRLNIPLDQPALLVVQPG